MFQRIWPTKINTPHIPLGMKFEDAIEVLKKIDENVIREDDGKEVAHRINANGYSLAIYEINGMVSSVWYDDPAGRCNGLGKRRKIEMYLERYKSYGIWEQRMNNGWITFYFNDLDKVSMAYGNHKDVLRFNMRAGNT